MDCRRNRRGGKWKIEGKELNPEETVKEVVHSQEWIKMCQMFSQTKVEGEVEDSGKQLCDILRYFQTIKI
jgi:hypothetical protein